MKKSLIAAGVTAAFLLTGCGAEKAAEEAPAEITAESLETLDQKISYIAGYGTAEQMGAQPFELDADIYAAGFQQGLTGEAGVLSDEEVEAAMDLFRNKMMTQQFEEQSKAQAKLDEDKAINLQISEAFLDINSKEDSVIITESGLQYKIITAGDGGEKPTVDSQVKVHYEGKLVDGEVFDSSLERGEPVNFGVSQVIPGWTEALQLMTKGAVWELYIHPSLAYGEQAPPSIGPNQALIFHVELLDIINETE